MHNRVIPATAVTFNLRVAGTFQGSRTQQQQWLSTWGSQGHSKAVAHSNSSGFQLAGRRDIPRQSHTATAVAFNLGVAGTFQGSRTQQQQWLSTCGSQGHSKAVAHSNSSGFQLAGRRDIPWQSHTATAVAFNLGVAGTFQGSRTQQQQWLSTWGSQGHSKAVAHSNRHVVLLIILCKIVKKY